jgi:hypothetical protein
MEFADDEHALRERPRFGPFVWSVAQIGPKLETYSSKRDLSQCSAQPQPSRASTEISSPRPRFGAMSNWLHCRVLRCFKGYGIHIKEFVVEEFLEIRNKIFVEDIFGPHWGGIGSGLRFNNSHATPSSFFGHSHFVGSVCDLGSAALVRPDSRTSPCG